MNIHFMDTSIANNILRIPQKSDDYEEVKREFEDIKNSSTDFIVIPLATIIETGNHISHIGDGDTRRKIAQDFRDMVRNALEENDCWVYYGRELSRDDIEQIVSDFPDVVLQKGMGIGDLSIVRAYNKYKSEVPAIGQIRIWSLDDHLRSYEERIVPVFRRNG